MSSFTTLNRHTLVDQVATQMRNDIVNGVYKASERLPSERERCTALGVSRTVLREAQSELIRAGYLEVKRGTGTFVRARSYAREQAISEWLSNHDDYITKLLDMRSVVEPGIAQLAATRIDARGCQALQKTVDRLRNSTQLDEAVEADEEFHLCLAKLTGNSLVVQLVQHTINIKGGERHVTLSTQKGIAAAAMGHQRVLDAIIRGDGAAASQEMLHHIEDARAFASKISRRQPHDKPERNT